MRILAVQLLLPLLVLAVGPQDWPQWGGPDRDFHARGSRLADSWPADGPARLWKRDLRGGASGIIVRGGTLYTMDGGGQGYEKRERVLALDARTGEPHWSHSYDVSYASSNASSAGPHATPLVTSELVVTVGIDAQVHALDAATGELRWRRDLVRDHDVDLPQSGYAASPVAWNDLVILPALGGRSPAALALSLATGETVWERHAFLSSHASPIVLQFGGREHVVFHGINFLAGLDPEDGDLLWRIRLRTNAMDNASFSPIWHAERAFLIVSHSYDGRGARAIRLSESNGRFAADEVWSCRRLKVEHGNGVVVDGVLYASDGSAPAYLAGVDVESGRSLFKQRGLAKANFVRAGDKLLILDEGGGLHLGRPSRDDVALVESRAVLEHNAWTAPTLAGRRLYVRDPFEIVSFELP